MTARSGTQVPVFNPPPDLLTVKQAAALLGIDPKALRNMIYKAVLIDCRIPGFPKRVLVSRKQLERYAAKKGIEIKANE
jgi:hypothetical protein